MAPSLKCATCIAVATIALAVNMFIFIPAATNGVPADRPACPGNDIGCVTVDTFFLAGATCGACLGLADAALPAFNPFSLRGVLFGSTRRSIDLSLREVWLPQARLMVNGTLGSSALAGIDISPARFIGGKITYVSGVPLAEASARSALASASMHLSLDKASAATAIGVLDQPLAGVAEGHLLVSVELPFMGDTLVQVNFSATATGVARLALTLRASNLALRDRGPHYGGYALEFDGPQASSQVGVDATSIGISAPELLVHTIGDAGTRGVLHLYPGPAFLRAWLWAELPHDMRPSIHITYYLC